MIHVKKSAQSLLIFMLTIGLSPAVSTASQPSASATNLVKKHSCSWNGCIKVFDRQSKLEEHIKIHTKEKSFQCPTCIKVFTQKQHLRRHMITHTEKKPFQCKRCRREFVLNYNLKQHLKRKNPCQPPESNSPVLAESSREIAERAAVLDQGVRRTRNQANSELTLPGLPPSLSPVISPASQPSKSTTNRLKKYACSWDECIKTFNRKSKLEEHMRVHTKEKPFQCPTCNKRFTTRSSLTRHIRIHTGEKPFQCTTCNKKFTARESLSQHLSIKNPCKPSEPNSALLAGSPSEIAVLATALDQGVKQTHNQANSEVVFPELLPLPPVQNHVESPSRLESYLYQPLQLDFKNKDTLPADGPMNFFSSDLPLPVSTNDDF